MFDVAPTELLIVALVALVVIGPKDLPKVMRTVGYWIGRARGMARHFRSGIDAMIRESELEEMEKKWKAENERIMTAHPLPAPEEPAIPPVETNQPMLPLPQPPESKPPEGEPPPPRADDDARGVP